MRSFSRLAALALAASLPFVGRVSAQGCDEGILTYTITCDTATHGIVQASRCSNFGSGGGSCEYCYQGSGDCIDSKKIDHQYFLASESEDESCPTCSSGCCQNPTQCYQDGSGQVCDQSSCTCQPGNSPIIIDTTGKGFLLTSAEAGVMFDIRGNGDPMQIAWTAPGSGNAFLALDRNHNGRIDNGKELFGNFTEQPKSGAPNGFLALAEFDKAENGGNGDGIIDKNDAVFSQLLLWIDENHDGISQPKELHPLPELGLFSLALRYRDDAHFFDEYGNWFHYQARINPDPGDGTSKDGRFAFDVFLVVNLAGANAQSSTSILRAQNEWNLSLNYDPLFGLPRQRKSGCRPKLQANSGGVQ
jgi:hypothetical protein